MYEDRWFYCKVRRKNGKFQILVWEKVALKRFGWFNLIHLDQVWARIGQFRPGSDRPGRFVRKKVCPFVPGSVRSVPVSRSVFRSNNKRKMIIVAEVNEIFQNLYRTSSTRLTVHFEKFRTS